jgi:hypothetical protein
MAGGMRPDDMSLDLAYASVKWKVSRNRPPNLHQDAFSVSGRYHDSTRKAHRAASLKLYGLRDLRRHYPEDQAIRRARPEALGARFIAGTGTTATGRTGGTGMMTVAGGFGNGSGYRTKINR